MILFSTHFKVTFTTVIWLKYWAALRLLSYPILQITIGVKVNHSCFIILNEFKKIFIGHFLVIVWREEYTGLLTVTPYGDYYDMITAADYGDGPLQVWETFVDPLVLR